MLHQFNTPPRIPKPSQVYNQNHGQMLHVILSEREQNHRYSTPQIKKILQQSPSTQITSPVQTINNNYTSPQTKQLPYQRQFQVSVNEQATQMEMKLQYNQIMQYYNELETSLQQQKQENINKYNEILGKIDQIQQIMVNNINQMNVNQKYEYSLLLKELQSQRNENQKRYEEIFANLAQQGRQNEQIQQLQMKEQLSKQYQQQQQQQQQIHQQQFISPTKQNNILYHSNDFIQQSNNLQDKNYSLEDQLFPDKIEANNQLYSQIHKTRSQPKIDVPNWGNQQNYEQNTFGESGYQTPALAQQQQSQKQIIKNNINYNQPMSNQVVQQTRSPRDQGCNCISPNNSRDESFNRKKQIFDKQVFEQINNKPIFYQHTPLQDQKKDDLQHVLFQPEESVLIEEPNNQQELLESLKNEYGISSLNQTTTLQYSVSQLQLIYCVFCDTYIALSLADSHMQECSKQKPMRRQNENYLDQYIIYKGNDLIFNNNIDTKIKTLCYEIQKIKQLIQLALAQRRPVSENIQMREFCQIAIIIIDKLLQNPISYQLRKFNGHINQIYMVVNSSSQIFYRQQGYLLQKCSQRIMELQNLSKK